MKKIMVSICCVTYNHERYIVQAIESFLKQQTNFEYEIIIGEDCSTDRTREIVRKLKKIFPTIIKVITSENNVGAKQNFTRIQKVAKGKYIALCEGDDYWIDPFKLQKQVDFMESHSEYIMCGHSVYVRDAEKNKIIEVGFENITNEAEGEVGFQELVKGEPFHTSSFVVRTELLGNSEWFTFYSKCSVGDYPMCLYAITKGKIYRFKEKMGVHNKNVEGSWTKKNTKSFENINRLYLNELNTIDEYYSLFNINKDFIEKRKEYLENIFMPMLNFYEYINSLNNDKLLNLNSLKKLSEERKKVYIFGAGSFGRNVRSILLDNVQNYIDSNMKLHNKVLDGIKIKKLAEINKDSTIIICSFWAKEIEQNLIENNYYNYFISVPF